jgi:hypothetical protein
MFIFLFVNEIDLKISYSIIGKIDPKMYKLQLENINY